MTKGQSHFDNLLVTNSQTARSLYALGNQTIATRVTGDPTAGNNGLFYIFSDHLGSTSVLATSNGTEVPGSRARYYPFGSPRTAPTQTITDRNFTGQKENMELGLIYYNARYYLPTIGRFASADTIVPDPNNPQQFNRYAYTLNNPVRFVDPAGHDVDCGMGDPSCHNQPDGIPGQPSTPTPSPMPSPTPTPTSTATPNSIEQQILGVTVQIVVNGKSFGHAVMIDENTLLTHNHFWVIGISSINSITIYDSSGNLICSQCNFVTPPEAFADADNGNLLDITEFNFSQNYFAGHSEVV